MNTAGTGGGDWARIDTTWKAKLEQESAQRQSQTWSGTEPTIGSTDTQALVPQVEAPVADPPIVLWDPLAPLDTTGFNFPDDPVPSPAQISAPSVSYDWEAPLQTQGLNYPDYTPPPAVSYTPELSLEGLVFPGPVSSVPAMFETSEPVWFNWQDPLDVTGFNFPEPQAGDGLLEGIGKFIGDVFGKVVEVGKFIIDNLDVGISYRGDFGGTQATKTYYQTLGGAPGTTILGLPGSAAPSSVRTSVSTGGGGGGGGPAMTESERLWREATQQTQADKTKLMIYAGGAYLAWVYLS